MVRGLGTGASMANPSECNVRSRRSKVELSLLWPEQLFPGGLA